MIGPRSRLWTNTELASHVDVREAFGHDRRSGGNDERDGEEIKRMGACSQTPLLLYVAGQKDRFTDERRYASGRLLHRYEVAATR
jgi:hypothetical protein